MLSYIVPIIIVIAGNIGYQVCAKSVPESLDPFASLTVTYFVGLVSSFIIYFILNRGESIIAEYHKLNIVPFAFGLILVILEGGFIYAYKAGWQVNTAFIVQSSFVAIGLIIVGALFYKEPVSWNKLVGVAICLVGLIFINYK